MGNSTADRTDNFKRAVGGAVRAIARTPELTVTFSANAAMTDGESAQLPLPPRDATAQDLAQVRGIGDSLALRLRHHDVKVHSS